MKFFAYNPLGGGLLTGKHDSTRPELSEGTRFSDSNVRYKGRYWKSEYFLALDKIKLVCESQGLNMSDCSIRWLKHHSLLREGDGIIVGASCMEHLVANLESCEAPPLPSCVVHIFDECWQITKPACEKYFRP